MRQSSYYYHTNISGTDFLLPFGQALFSRKKAISVNRTGLLIWYLLSNPMSTEVLIRRLGVELGFDVKLPESFRNDIADYIDTLFEQGIIVDEKTEKRAVHFSDFRNPYKCEKINLTDFNIETPDWDIVVYITSEHEITTNGSIPVYGNASLKIYDTGREFIFLFQDNQYIWGTSLTHDGNKFTLFVKEDTNRSSDTFKSELFDVMTIPYLYSIQSKNTFLLHSSSIIVDGKAYLFLGPAGTEKNTHAKLWAKKLGAKLGNPNKNLITRVNHIPMLIDSPWNKLNTGEDTEIAGIILLKNGDDGTIDAMPEDKILLRLWQHTASPLWTSDGAENSLMLYEKIREKIPVHMLTCTPDMNSFELLKHLYNL